MAGRGGEGRGGRGAAGGTVSHLSPFADLQIKGVQMDARERCV